MANPLNIEADDGSSSSQRSSGWCWEKVIDYGEAKTQIMFALPMVLTYLFYYLIRLASVMFVGHLGDVELAASNLAASWANVTGFAFMVGSSGALETLCGQGFGAKMYKMLGVYLQASCIISLFFSILISVLWFYTEPILIFLHQDPEISRATAQYMKLLIPGLFAYGFQQNVMRFLQTQNIVVPLVVFSAVPCGTHFGIVYWLVNKTSLGFKGAPIAASISMWISFLSLFAFVIFTNKFNNTWKGFSFEAFHHILQNAKLALPSAAMVCLECWAFEILVVLAGLMPNPDITTSLMALCVNTQNISYMIIWGLSAAASTRVSNELGAGNSNRAKRAMIVSLKLAILLASVVALALAFGHNIWVGFFTHSHTIINKFAKMMRFLVVSLVIDMIQCVLSGIARGCGWQNMAVLANLGTFYCIGMPVAVVLGFKFKLYVKGLWIGLLCGLSCQACTFIFITFYRKFKKIDLLEDTNKNQTQLSV